MRVEKTAPQASVAEVLDRVLDRGIVIDAWLRVSVAGITLIEVDARVVVASISTYVRQSDAVARAALGSRPSPPVAAMRPADRPAGGSRVRLRCEQGCTFVRTERRKPVRVRCPFRRGQTCRVQTVPQAA